MVYPTVSDILFEYLTFVMLEGDDLGLFLAHFRWLWARAYFVGVSHFDGIQRLIRLLPSDWVGYALDLTRYYLFPVPPFFDVVGNFPEFIGELHLCFILHGQAPRGPYVRPGDLAAVGFARVFLQPVPPPEPVASPPVAPQPVPPQPEDLFPLSPSSLLGRRTRREFEAGPSRLPVDEDDLYHISSSSPSLAGTSATDSEARELRAAAAERRRRGKAPISSSEMEEDEPKVVVGTGRLQPLPLPTETRPETPPGEIVPPTRQEPTPWERRPRAWARRHWGVITRGPHAPGTTMESAFNIDESSDEEEPEEEELGTAESTI